MIVRALYFYGPPAAVAGNRRAASGPCGFDCLNLELDRHDAPNS